jgi:hypothetical protein
MTINFPGMKKTLFVTLIILLVLSCKKTKTEPLGPTDIRIKNLIDMPMTNVMVNTYDTTINFGTINAQSYSQYFRFNRAYNTKANISAYINGVRYKTDTVTKAIYSYEVYLGQMKATYEVYSDVPRHLIIKNTTTDAPLK